MTQEEFNQKRWNRDTVIYHIPTNKTFHVLSVDFDEALIGVDEAEFIDIVSEDDYGSVKWLRCENCEILNESGND